MSYWIMRRVEPLVPDFRTLILWIAIASCAYLLGSHAALSKRVAELERRAIWNARVER